MGTSHNLRDYINTTNKIIQWLEESSVANK